MNNYSEWVSLRHAAEILGVHPATVRNWADKGDLPSRRTPGGHRRFRRSDLERLAEQHSTSGNPTNEVQLILQNALGQARMEITSPDMQSLRWYSNMSEKSRITMREQGRLVLDAIRTYLDNNDGDENLAAAIRIGKVYASCLHDDSMPLPDAVRGFFFFSNFVLDSVLSWSEVSTMRDKGESAALLRQVNDFTNTMLLSIIEYYEED